MSKKERAMGIVESVSGAGSRKVSGVPGTGMLGKSVTRVVRRAPGALEQSGAVGGARTAETAFVDENMGSTLPPGVDVVEQRAASEVAGVWGAMERAFAINRKRLRRKGATLDLRRRRLEAANAAVSPTTTEEEVHPAETRRIALGFWIFLAGMSLANAGLDLAIFEVLALPFATTAVLAIAVGLAQTFALYSAGGKIRDLYADKATPGKAIVITEIAAAIGVGLAAAYLRAYRLVPLPGLQLRIPGFWAAFAVFAAFSLAVDTAIFALGHRFAGTVIRARLVNLRKGKTAVRHCHRAERRFDKSLGRFRAFAERALGQVRVAGTVIDRALADHAGAVAAFFEEATVRSDAATGAELAVMAEQRTGLLEELRAQKKDDLARALAELTTLIHHHDPTYVLLQPEVIEPEVIEPEVIEPEVVESEVVQSDDPATKTIEPEATDAAVDNGPSVVELPDSLTKVAVSPNGHGPAIDDTLQDTVV